MEEKLPRIDRLFNVAGVLLPDVRRSPAGNELHYEVNTLAPLLLTASLTASLAAATSPRVLNVVSDPMAKPTQIDFEVLHRPTEIKKLFGSYMQSKLALAHATAYLAAQPAWKRIDLVSVTPGPNKTAMTSGYGMPSWLKPIRNVFFPRPTKGADLLHRASFRGDIESGDFLKSDKRVPLGFSLDTAGFDLVVKGIDPRHRPLLGPVVG